MALLSFFVLFALAIFCFDFLVGIRKVRSLSSIEPLVVSHASPRVTLIATARNEERNIEAALASHLAQDYPNLEVLILNDRSSDSTPQILERMQRANPRLRVKHIRELPAGWLGKCHALWTGSKEASGDYLLFTDADVVMEPSTVRRAMRVVLDDKLDFLTLIPLVDVKKRSIRFFCATFGFFFASYSRMWKARDPKSKAFVGIGAFSLVRAEAYRRMGTHEVVRMRPDDDIKLAKAMKKAGFSQDVLFAEELVSVEWYSSLREMVGGLEKNSYAGIEYNFAFLLGSTLMMLGLYVWPFVGLFASHGSELLANLASVGILALVFRFQAQKGRISSWAFLTFPVAVCFFLFVLWRSALLAIMRGGIDWRGTFYSLEQLKKNRV